MLRALILISLFLVQACSGIKILRPENIYNKEFLQKIDGIKTVFKNGDSKEAFRKLNLMKDEELDTSEQAVKYNLMGLIFYSGSSYNEALSNFKRAKKLVSKDIILKSKIYLNLGSSYFKLNEFEAAFNEVQEVDDLLLSQKEKKSLYELTYILANQLQNHKAIVNSVINLSLDKKSFKDIDASSYREALLNSFSKLSDEERDLILKKDYRESSLVVPYLGKTEIYKLYFKGDKNQALDLVSFLKRRYGHLEEVQEFISDFDNRMKNYSTVDISAIGVVVPLSGKNKLYGERVLKGLDTVIHTEESENLKPTLYLKDSQDTPVVAEDAVRSLIEKHHVSVIIGGLFPGTAKEEYLEAKKYGVIFISLSPIFLDKVEKNHLLIEIPGSVESQIDSLIESNFIKKFGNRVAIFYPDDEAGKSYINEIWRRYKSDNLELTSIHSYAKSLKDFREPVMRSLDLKFKRERQEELDVWKDVYKLEGKTSIRRIQTLKPVIDFDWVFLPGYPHEAIQIIPTFSYFDAKNLKYVGGPSWMSRSLVNEQRNLGTLYFIGDDPKEFNQNFVESYRKRNNEPPKLIETLSFEGGKVALDLLKKSNAEDRNMLNSSLLSLNGLKGVTGDFFLKEGIWIKSMDLMRIQRNSIKKVELEDEEAQEAN